MAGFGIVTPALLSAGGVAAPVLALVPGSDGGTVVWLPSPGVVSVVPPGVDAAGSVGTVSVPGRGSTPEPVGLGRALPPVERGALAGAAALEDGDGLTLAWWPRSARRCERRRTERDADPAVVAVDVVGDTPDPAAAPSSPARTTRTAASASRAPVKKKRRWRRSTTFS